eukprot:Phypoly_transcript_02954.p1 GENE.Phypoly_transcript_02954~~Phypoly_transcript_02954.p1  ORF type:complete len:796 (+),score=103.49 Phypoly_transcript_02954:213-2600(+)
MPSCSVCKAFTPSGYRQSLSVVRRIINGWNGNRKEHYTTLQTQKDSRQGALSHKGFTKKPAHFWTIPSNCINAMRDMGTKLGYVEYDDWYKIKSKDFLDNDMHGLLKAYHGCAARAVMALFHEREWQPWRFEPTPKGFWDKDHALPDFMKYLGEKMGFKTLEDWYKVKNDDIIRHGGSNLLQHKYGGSTSKMVMDTWKDHKWHKWKFVQVPKGFWDNLENQKEFVEYAKQSLNITNFDDWYKIKESDLAKLGGKQLLQKHSASPSSHHHPPVAQLVMKILNDHDWDVSRFITVHPPKSPTFEDRRALLQQIGNTLQYHKNEDYYKLSQPLLHAHGGSSLLETYKGVREVVITLFPEHPWEPWKFNSTSLWESTEIKQKYMQYLFTELGYKTMEDWYKITLGDFRANHGTSLAQKYKNRASSVVMDIFHSHEWEPWLFQQLPPDFWDSREILLRFMHNLGDKLGYKTMEDWYQITSKDIRENGGKDLLQKFKAPSEIVMETFCEHLWHPWKFPVVPKKFWNSKESKLKFLEYLGQKLGFTEKEHWYGIRQRDFVENGGTRLLTLYNFSPSSIVMAVMTDHEWIRWKFNKAHSFSSSLHSPASLKSYLSYVSKQMQIKDLSDWYRVALPQLEEYGPTTYFKKLGLPNALQQVFPEHHWDLDGFQLAWQRWLKTILQKHLPNIEIIENYVSSLHFDGSGIAMTADIFIPSLNLALEYNGKPHYTGTPLPGNLSFYSPASDSFFGNAHEQKKYDTAKIKKFAENGISLIQVPHWWDGKIGSLVDVIHKIRPDIQIPKLD